MVKRRVGGLVKAYVFSCLYCFYRIVALGCMDGIIMFHTSEDWKKFFGDDNLTYEEFDAYYNECIEEMLPF